MMSEGIKCEKEHQVGEKILNRIMDFSIKHKIWFVAGGIIFILILPWMLDLIIFRNSVYSALSNGEWAGFLGSYLGGVLGGFCTLVTVMVTVRINQRQMLKAEQDRALAENEKIEEKKAAQYIKIVSETIGFISDIEIFLDIQREHNRKRGSADSRRREFDFLKGYYEKDLRNERYCNSWDSYLNALRKAGQSTIIPEDFKREYNYHYDASSSLKPVGSSYAEYGKYLTKEIKIIRETIDELDIEYEENKRRLIIGNLHYLYLDATLEVEESYKELLNQLHILYEKCESGYDGRVYDGKYANNNNDSYEDCIEKIKIELKNSKKLCC